MPNTYGYCRISFLDETKTARRGHEGLSIGTQEQRVRAYYDYQCGVGADLAKAPWGTKGWHGTREEGKETKDGFFIDRDVSAYKKPFLARPAGRRLSATLEAGDSIIFSRLDRAFRSVKDAVVSIDLWQNRAIHIHFIDPQVDLSTAHGRAFLQMSAVWAEFSSALHSERIREVARHGRLTGRALNNYGSGFGWRTHPGSNTPQPCYRERAVLAWVVYLRDTKGLSWRGLANVIEEELARRENRAPVPMKEGEGKREWGFNRCIRGYRAAKEDLELEPIPELPANLVVIKPGC